MAQAHCAFWDPPRWSALGVLTLVLTLVGCGTEPPRAPATVQPAPPSPITLEELRSAEYPADILDVPRVRLTEGVYPAPALTMGQPPSFELTESVALGEPGPDLALAAVVTRETGGGSGMFYWLHLLQRRSGPPTVVASAFLGDRVEILELRLAADTVTVRMVTQGPTDAYCCPTLEVRKQFVRAGETLREVGGT